MLAALAVDLLAATALPSNHWPLFELKARLQHWDDVVEWVQRKHAKDLLAHHGFVAWNNVAAEDVRAVLQARKRW
jgi:phage gp16-like protein